MRTEQLRTFLSLIETGNFSRTAKQLYVSQSTVSKRIAELENELGYPLFTRGAGGVRPTFVGQSLQEYASIIVKMEENAIKHIRLTAQFPNYIVMGSTHTYYDSHLQYVLSDFLDQHPDVSVNLKIGHSFHLNDELIKGSLEIVFSHHTVNYPEYTSCCLSSDPLVLITNAQNTEYSDGIKYNEIKYLPMIDTNFLYESTRQHLLSTPYQPRATVSEPFCAIPLIQKNNWYAIMNQRIVAPMIQEGTFIEIPILGNQIPPVQNYIIYRTEIEKRLGVSDFLEILKSHETANQCSALP